MRIKKIPNFIIFIVLFMVALLPRIYHLDQTTIYPDEISWIVRGKELIFALKQGNFKYFDTVWWKSATESEAIALPLTVISGTSVILLGQNQSKISLDLFSDILAARLPVAFLTALLIPIFFLFASRIIPKPIAALTALLLAFDPIHVALSRWVMLDGLLTLFTFSTIYFFILALENKKWLILASLMLALAFLTKPLGILAAISWVVILLFNKQSVRNKLIIFGQGIFCFFIFIWLLWPGMWDKPILSVFQYLWQQRFAAEAAYSIFFLGQITTQPPFYYYFFQILTRLPSFISLIFLFSLVLVIYHLWIKKDRVFTSSFIPPLSLLVFAGLFLLAISLTPLKLGVRYALALWPIIYLVFAWVIYQLVKTIKYKLVSVVLTTVLIIGSAWTLFSYFPDYYLFYNELIGGPKNAQKYDMVGHCLASKKALDYVKTHYPLIKSVAILGCSNVTAPYYFSGTITTNWKSEHIVIMENTFEQLSSPAEVINHFKSSLPHFIVEENGVILAKIYLQ